jgi:hypothetical protein
MAMAAGSNDSTGTILTSISRTRPVSAFRALAKQYGISKSVVAARIARVRKRLTADPWTEEPKRRRRSQPASEAPSAGSPAPAREEVVPALQRAYTYSDWLDDRDVAAGRITAQELGRRRAPRAIRFVRL